MARQNLNLAEVYGAVDRSRANQMDMENARMQQEQFRNQVARQQREDAERDGIRNVFRNATTLDENGNPVLDDKKTITGLYGIAPEKAMEYQQSVTKRRTEESKLKREEQKANIENKTATITYLKNRLATIQDESGYQAFKQEAQELGAEDLVKSAPPQFDPNWQRSQMVNADKFLEQNTPKYERVDLGGKIQIVDVNPVTNPNYGKLNLDKVATISEKESMRHNRVQEGISGANLGISQQRLAFDKSGGTAAVNAASGVTAKPDKFTEGMRSAAQYAQRMTAAEALLTGNKEQAPSLTEKAAGMLGETAANVTRSPERQKSLQAQRDWVRAKLRKESGAAIGVDEMENEIRTYFPQIGDSEAVKQQKALARQQATQGLIQSAGSAYTPPAMPEKPIMNRQQATMPKAPKLGTVDGGYVYTGGNPSDPKSWKKK
jgi:hypothetical protein